MKRVVIFVLMLILGPVVGVYAETKNVMGNLSSDPADFKRLGLNENTPEAWEDGQRLREDVPGKFEWWYTDGHFSDGKIMVASFHFWAGYNGKMYPMINLLISDNEKVYCDTHIPGEPDDFNTAKGGCDVRIGKSYFKSLKGLERYEIYIDPATNNGFGAHVFLDRSVPSYRPGTGHWEAGEKVFAWFCAVPGGEMKGTLFIDGKSVNVNGSGYHDHNWGNVAMNDILSGWVWGRAEVNDLTIVAANVFFTESHGGMETPLLYISKGDNIILSALKNELSCLEGGKIPHPYSGKMTTNDCTFIVKGNERVRVRFMGGKTIAARGGYNSSYIRFASTTTINVDRDDLQINVEGPSIFENMDLKGR